MKTPAREEDARLQTIRHGHRCRLWLHHLHRFGSSSLQPGRSTLDAHGRSSGGGEREPESLGPIRDFIDKHLDRFPLWSAEVARSDDNCFREVEGEQR